MRTRRREATESLNRRLIKNWLSCLGNEIRLVSIISTVPPRFLTRWRKTQIKPEGLAIQYIQSLKPLSWPILPHTNIISIQLTIEAVYTPAFGRLGFWWTGPVEKHLPKASFSPAKPKVLLVKRGKPFKCTKSLPIKKLKPIRNQFLLNCVDRRGPRHALPMELAWALTSSAFCYLSE